MLTEELASGTEAILGKSKTLMCIEYFEVELGTCVTVLISTVAS